MALEARPIESIQLSDLEALVADKVDERKTLEYKEALHLERDAQKTEFLCDVCSLANASGGHLLYGVRADNGIPTEICGTEIPNPDGEILRIEALVRDGIELRIPGINTRVITVQGTKAVVILRIPRSWVGPHRVTFHHDYGFYSRGSNGRQRLDIGEIRIAFLASEALAERIRRFRAERLAAIVAGETPVSLGEGAKTVLHIVPIRAFDPANMLSASSLAGQAPQLQPIVRFISSSRYNLDGFVTFDRGSGGSSADSYAQLFRSGCLEAVDMDLLRQRDVARNTPSKSIPSVAFEEHLLEAMTRYLAALKNLGVAPPLFVMLSMLGVAGYVMGVSPERFFSIDILRPIDRNDLILPEVVLEGLNPDRAALDRLIQPVFDAIWNACGWPRSINYDDSGNRVPHS